jgi:hypothetical protein
MALVQFNPSTLKANYDGGTSKVKTIEGYRICYATDPITPDIWEAYGVWVSPGDLTAIFTVGSIVRVIMWSDAAGCTPCEGTFTVATVTYLSGGGNNHTRMSMNERAASCYCVQSPYCPDADIGVAHVVG